MNDKVAKLVELEKMLKNSDDEEFRALISDEIQILKSQLIPPHKEDDNNAILEIRAGTGGEEAELFASELVRMYLRLVENKGWKISIQNQNRTPLGGIKEFIATVSGSGAYGQLKYEGGVHRVQRVPKTEKGGRVHTSAATIAVLPEVEEKEIEIKSENLKIDVYRASGHGGQSVNTTDSAVRITHLPSGLVVTCQDERSQLKNREKALSILRSKLWQKQQDEKEKKQGSIRSLMVKSGDRSEKIRTYNFPQDRVTDHRLPKSWSNIEKILSGHIDEIIDSLKTFEQDSKIKQILSDATAHSS